MLTLCLESGPLTEAKARYFFRDILSAVEYLHRNGIVHHDLKLENCLLDEKHCVKLIDFGLATSLEGNSHLTACGSANYAAPELFTAKTFLGPPIDVFAMGVML